jgi:hypothetical protein
MLLRARLKTTSFARFKVLDEKFNPQNTPCIPVVKFFIRLELVQNQQFSNRLLRKQSEDGLFRLIFSFKGIGP